MNDNHVVNPLRRMLWYTVPATLFLLYSTYYAWKHGGEILVFLGVTAVFGGTVVAAFEPAKRPGLRSWGVWLTFLGLALFLVGAFWHPTQQ